MPRDHKCIATKADGTQCQASALKDSDYCFFHDPAKAKERTAARKRGGQTGRATTLPATAPDLPLKDGRDVVVLLGQTINQVRRGAVDPRVANAVGYLTGVLLKALEVGDLEERLSFLEETIAKQPPKPENLIDADFETEDVAFVFEPAP